MKTFLHAIIWLTLLGLPVCAESVVVGSKKFTESVILGDVAAQLIRASGIEAIHRRELGGTRVFQPLTVRRAVAEVGKPEFDRSLLVPLRYSAGMMLGDAPFGLFGPDSARAFGHLGFTNNFIWADPERDITVALLTTGKLVLGLHAPFLLNLLHRISKHCRKLSEDEQQARLIATGMV